MNPVWGRIPRMLDRIIIVVPVLFLLGYLLVNFSRLNINYDEYGDFALNAVQIEKARHFQEYLGPYSRLGFNHPGPISFYYFAATESLFPFLKSPYSKHIIAQLILNGTLYMLTFVILWRSLCRKCLIWFYFFFSLLALSPLGNAIYFCAWGPGIIIIPFGLYFICMVKMALGSVRYLPIATLAALLMAHNHIGTLPVMSALFLLSCILYINTFRRQSIGRLTRSDYFAVGIALGIMAIANFPVLYQQFSGDWGNLGKIFGNFSTQSPIEQSLRAGLDYGIGYYAEPLKLNSHRYGLMIFLIISSIFNYLKPQQRFTSYLVSFCLTGLAAFLLSALKIKGSLEPYLFWFQYVLVGFFYFTSLCGIVHVGNIIWNKIYNKNIKVLSMNHLNSVFAIIFWIACICLSSYVFFKYCRINSQPVNSKLQKIYTLIQPDHHFSYFIGLQADTPHHYQWGEAAGVALKLFRQGHKVYVPDHQVYDTMFTGNFKYKPQPSEKIKEIWFYTKAQYVSQRDYTGGSVYEIDDAIIVIKEIK